MNRNRYFSKGRPRKPGEMNGTEKAYANYLNELKHSGVIIDYWFEAIKLKLADKTHYTPDFFVLRNDMQLEVHEVKGFMRDDANVKLKVAAASFPFKFKLCRLIKKQWEITEV